MNERITIHNFAGIRHLELDLRPINILIGSQATGKSICAKLLYHFKGFVFDIFSAVENEQTREELDDGFLREFEEYFPPESWGTGAFAVRYAVGDEFIEVSKGASETATTKLSYSGVFRDQLRLGRREIEKAMKGRPDAPQMDRWFAVSAVRVKLLAAASSRLGRFAGYSQVFIPAGRSFFAHLQSSVFSYLSTNKAIDPLLTEFGQFYENMKHVQIRTRAHEEHDNDLKRAIDKTVESILHGKHVREKGKDYLQHNDGRRTSLANASSGQQELLPLAIILSLFPFALFERRGFSIYIEEPEAHLFPTSQRAIVQLLAMVFNTSKNPLQFFVTTHSPYILTSMNNLMQAGYLLERLPENEHARVRDIVPKEQIIRPSDVSAYALEAGSGQRLCCDETGLIPTNVIDDVSDALSVQFGDLLEVE